MCRMNLNKIHIAQKILYIDKYKKKRQKENERDIDTE